MQGSLHYERGEGIAYDIAAGKRERKYLLRQRISNLVDGRCLIETVVGETGKCDRIPNLADADDGAVSPRERQTSAARECNTSTADSVGPGGGSNVGFFQARGQWIII